MVPPKIDVNAHLRTNIRFADNGGIPSIATDVNYVFVRPLKSILALVRVAFHLSQLSLPYVISGTTLNHWFHKVVFIVTLSYPAVKRFYLIKNKIFIQFLPDSKP